METIYNFTNEEIALHKEQQLFLFERVKSSLETYDFHHKKFMVAPTPENEMRSLKAFEHMTYDLNNLKLHQQRELEERLRVANELLRKNGITLA